MDLKDFVKTAFADILGGIAEAREAGGFAEGIATSDQFKIDKMHQNLMQDYAGRLYTIINFDVAVTTTDRVEGGGGISVFAMKASGKVEGMAETASRLQFAIPVRLS